jgi:phosphate transport system ATP-binding protein
MGAPLGEFGLLKTRPDKSAKLVVTHRGDRELHRAKVTIEHLDFFYGRTQALKHICLTVPEHQVTSLIGPSGCGKSTLLRILNRIYSMYPGQHATGTVLLDGEDIIGPLVDLRRLRSRVGMVFQEITAFPMSIYENVAFGTRLHEQLSHVELNMRVEEALTRVALWPEVKDRLQSPASALSGGQQQRLCIARALSTRPEVVLLDEPTSALDPTSMMKIENLIDQLKLTTTIALVTHNLQQAARCADQVAFFYLGELIEAGTALQMFTNPHQVRTQNYITGRFG